MENIHEKAMKKAIEESKVNSKTSIKQEDHLGQ